MYLFLVVERGDCDPVHQPPSRVGGNKGVVLVVLTCREKIRKFICDIFYASAAHKMSLM